MSTLAAMKTPKRLPIKTIQFHIEGLRQREHTSCDPREITILTLWHTNAIAYLQFGARHKLGGPGAEKWVDGKPHPTAIEEYLTLMESGLGDPYVIKTFKKAPDNA